MDGEAMLLVAMSLKRSLLLVREGGGGVAPGQKNTKKVTQTAHSMIDSHWFADDDQRALIWQRIIGPIGRHGLTLLENLCICPVL